MSACVINKRDERVYRTMAECADTAKVNRARRAAWRAGYEVRKSRRRLSLDNMGGLMLVDQDRNVIAGERFDLTPGDVMAYCEEETTE